METLGKKLANVYLDAYNEAMERTFNDEMAMNVAMAVTYSVAQSPQKNSSDIMSRIFSVALNHEEKPKSDRKRKGLNNNEKRRDSE